MKKINKSIKFLLALSVFLSTSHVVLASQNIQQPDGNATDANATIEVNSRIGAFDNTDPEGGEIIDPETGELVPNHLNWLNISVPTVVAFYSVDPDHTELTSADFTITNHSGRGVDVTVNDFSHTGGDNMDSIRTLNLVPGTGTVTSATVELVDENDGIITTPATPLPFMTIERVVERGVDRIASFTFAGTADTVTSTVNPTFDLVLGFAVNGNH